MPCTTTHRVYIIFSNLTNIFFITLLSVSANLAIIITINAKGSVQLKTTIKIFTNLETTWNFRDLTFVDVSRNKYPSKNHIFCILCLWELGRPMAVTPFYKLHRSSCCVHKLKLRIQWSTQNQNSKVREYYIRWIGVFLKLPMTSSIMLDPMKI